MKLLLGGIIVIAISLCSYAQDVEFKGTDKVSIEWGPELKAKKRSTLEDIIGFDDNNLYTIKFEGKGLMGKDYVLESYDHKLALGVSEDLDLDMTGRDRSLEFMLHLDDKLHLFTSRADTKTKMNSLYYQNVDKESMTPNGKLIDIVQIDYSGHSKWNSGLYGYDLSRDSSKILIYYNLPYERGEAEKFGFKVYDNGMNELWSEEIILPYEDKLFSIEDYKVDNGGNVHLVGRLYKEVYKTKRRGNPNYTYQVLSYFDEGKNFKEYTISLDDRFLTDLQVAITDDQNIVCGGFYSDKGSFSIKGSYFLKVNGETKEIMHKSFKEFGIDFITQNMTERQEKNKKKKESKGKTVELYEYDLDDIVIRSDGGAMLIGEQYYWYTTTTTTTNSNGGTSTTTIYHYVYNDIIVINIDPEGEIVWTEKIAKRQHTTNDNGFYSSYALAAVGSNLYFFFNDNPKNLEYTGSGKVYGMNGKKSVVTMVELDSDGKQERESLFAAKDAEVMARPKVCEQISSKELILFGQKKKTQRFARIKF
jgi:hypothetical protein